MITVQYENFDAMIEAAKQLLARFGGNTPAPVTPEPVVQPPDTPVVAPVQQQMPAQVTQPVAPVQQAAAPATQTQVATVTPTYTIEQMQQALMPIVDAGRTAELVAILQGFGVVSLQELSSDQYPAFVTAIRGLGAQI